MIKYKVYQELRVFLVKQIVCMFWGNKVVGGIVHRAIINVSNRSADVSNSCRTELLLMQLL